MSDTESPNDPSSNDALAEEQQQQSQSAEEGGGSRRSRKLRDGRSSQPDDVTATITTPTTNASTSKPTTGANSSGSEEEVDGDDDNNNDDDGSSQQPPRSFQDSDEDMDEIYDKPAEVAQKIASEITDVNLEDDDENADDKKLLDDLERSMAFFNTSNDGGVTLDPTFIRLREEYDRLHKIFVQSRSNEKRLMKKMKDMTVELGSNAVKVQAALKVSQTDRGLISSLKKEVKKAWKMVESGTEKEARAKEAIASLKAEVEGLRRANLEQGGTAAATNVKASAAAGRNKLLEYQMGQEESIKELILVSKGFFSWGFCGIYRAL